MASPRKFSMQGALDIAIFDLENGDLDGYLEDCTATGLEMTAEKVYSLGKGGAYVTGFSTSRRANVTVTHGYPTSEILAIQSGQDVLIGTNTNVMKVETLTVTTNATATSFTALGTAGSEIGSLWVLDGSGGFLKKLTQAGTASATEFTYTVGTKAIVTSGLTDGTKLMVAYKYTTDATAQTIKFDTNKFAGNKKVVMTGLAVDNCSDKKYMAQLIFNKMAIGDGFSYSFEDTGEPIVQSMELTALSSCSSKTLMEWVIYDEELAQ